MSPSIRGLVPGLPEVGKIKNGRKGDARQGSNGTYNLPQKVGHFILTTLEREKDGANFVRDVALYQKLKLEDRPKKIKIRLLFDDINLNIQSRYACYTGKTLFCSGDGVGAFELSKDGKGRSAVKCPCHRIEVGFKGDDGRGNGKCKIHTKLSCLIDGASIIGGVSVLRTTSYNTTVGMYGSLMLIRTMTGGVLAGLPLALVVRPKIATDPDGKSQTIYVVGIEFDGSMEDLQAQSLQLATKNAEYRQRLIGVEDEVRKMISVDAEYSDESGDITEEFHPEEQDAPEIVKPVAQTNEPAPTSEPTQEPAPAETAVAEPVKRGRKPKTTPAPAVQPEAVDPQLPPAATEPTPAAPEPTPAAPAPRVGLDLFS
jgi:hypothetical protein